MEFFKQCPSKRPEDMKQMKTTSSASYNCLGEWPVLILEPVEAFYVSLNVYVLPNSV